MINEIKQLSDREHLLLRPNMYIGATDAITSSEYVLNDDGISEQELTYVPGLIKIINEIIDNSVDVAIKSGFTRGLNISVELTENTVTISDDGIGIPNVIESNTNKLMPLLAWGSAKAGSNFDDTNRTQIGMNGIGSFATNVFSVYFIGISDDGKVRGEYKWQDNASVIAEPKLTKSKASGCTVSFSPDLKRFNLSTIDNTHMALIKERLINLKLSYPQLNFKLNKQRINVGSFKKFVSLFNPNFEYLSTPNFDYAILPNQHDDFRALSYVNGLNIREHGTHIDYVINAIVMRIRDKLMRKYKGIKPGDIRNKLMCIAFLRDFPNPKFNSQSKEKITNSNAEVSSYLGNIDLDKLANAVWRNEAIISPITEVYKLKEELKRRQALKDLDKPKKIKDEKYLPSIGKTERLLIVEGECLAHDTKVMLADYSTKLVRNLKIGDSLIGSDLAPCQVTAVSKLIKPCVELKTSAGVVHCTKEHRFKVYDTKERDFVCISVSEMRQDPKRYKLLKSKINTTTRGLKVVLIGKGYVITNTGEFVRFTPNDTFTIIRNGIIMPIKGCDLEIGDVLTLSELSD